MSSIKLTKGKVIFFSVVLFLLFIGILGSGDDVSQDNENQIATSDAEKIEEQQAQDTKKEDSIPQYSHDQQVNDFKSYYKAILEIDNQEQAIYDNAMNNIKLAGNGTKSAPELYVDLKRSKDAMMRARTKFIEIKVPDSLQNDFGDRLNDAASNLSTSYYTLSNALGDMAEYINSNDMKKYEHSQNNAEQSQSFKLDAFDTLMSVASDLNIPVEELISDL